MENENLNSGTSVLEKINRLIRSGDTTRELENEHTITCLNVMGDYFVELTLDKTTREIISMDIKEDLETLLKYFKEDTDLAA